MTSACIARIATAALALLAPSLAHAIDRCDKNHYILISPDEPCLPQWAPVNVGLTDLDVRVVTVDPVRKTTLYAGGPAGVFKSADGGASWSMTGLEMAPRNAADTAAAFERFPDLSPRFKATSLVAHLAIDSRSPDTLYAATNSTHSAWYGQRRLLKSTDGGGTWTDSASPPGNGVFGPNLLALAPNAPGTIYFGTFDFMDGWVPVARSTDGAATWSYLSYPSVNVLAMDPLDSRTLYAGTVGFSDDLTGYPNGVLKTSDGGETWDVTGLAGVGIAALTLDPGDRRTLYAATGNSLFKTIDGAATWTKLDARLDGFAVTALLVDAGDSNTIYAATNGGGISRSLDGGATWAAFNAGLESLVIRSLVLVAGNPNTLYAGTAAGVFKTTD